MNEIAQAVGYCVMTILALAVVAAGLEALACWMGTRRQKGRR